jgi:hypothetical protein
MTYQLRRRDMPLINRAGVLCASPKAIAAWIRQVEEQRGLMRYRDLQLVA